MDEGRVDIEIERHHPVRRWGFSPTPRGGLYRDGLDAIEICDPAARGNCCRFQPRPDQVGKLPHMSANPGLVFKCSLLNSVLNLISTCIIEMRAWHLFVRHARMRC